MIKIGHILGDWSRNIGNAFFQLGGFHVLKKVLPDSKISLIAEQPGYPSYWNPKGGNPQYYFDMSIHMDIDILVLMGPMFRPETLKIWGPSLEVLQKKGTKLVFLGVAAMNYDAVNLKSYREFLTKYPPYILTSRDTKTFKELGDLAQHAYDGIDFGFFVSDIYEPIGFRKDFNPFIALNFDKIPEPTITIFDKNENAEKVEDYNKLFEFAGMQWGLRYPKFRQVLANQSRYFMFLEGVLFKGEENQSVGKYNLVRTEHRPHPMTKRKTYRSPSVMMNDVPYPYLEIYSQAELTLSNRIHACVAAISYGKPAMLFSNSPRVRMLERLGLSQITQKPLHLDLDYLKHEKGKMEKFLSKHLGALG